jgi:hypothetical protein
LSFFLHGQSVAFAPGNSSGVPAHIAGTSFCRVPENAYPEMHDLLIFSSGGRAKQSFSTSYSFLFPNKKTMPTVFRM